MPRSDTPALARMLQQIAVVKGNARNNFAPLVVDDLLFLASLTTGIKMFNISKNGDKFVSIGTLKQPSLDLATFTRNRTRVLVAAGKGRLVLYDISKPTMPIEISSTPTTPCESYFFHVSNDTQTVYLLGATSISVADIQDLKHPKFLANVFELPASHYHLEGSLAVDKREDKQVLYVALAARNTVLVFDIAGRNRLLPSLKHCVLSNEIPLAFAQRGDLMVVSGTLGLALLDVTDPFHAKLIQDIDTNTKDQTALSAGFSTDGKTLFVLSLGRENRITEYRLEHNNSKSRSQQQQAPVRLRVLRVGRLTPGYQPWDFDFYKDKSVIVTNSGHTEFQVFSLQELKAEKAEKAEKK